MKKITIKMAHKQDTVTHSIRIPVDLWNNITKISRKTGVSFSKITQQFLELALSHYEEDKE